MGDGRGSALGCGLDVALGLLVSDSAEPLRGRQSLLLRVHEALADGARLEKPEGSEGEERAGVLADGRAQTRKALMSLRGRCGESDV